jgi:hypothetical protein
MAKSIEEKRQARAAFMNALYDASDGSERYDENYWAIGTRAGLDEDEAQAVAEYLVAEGLASWEAMGSMLGITHLGVVEVEESRTRPDRPTEHLAAFNMIVGNVYNSQIQQGTIGSIQLKEEPERLTSDVRALIKVFRQHLDALSLPDDQREEAEAELATLQAQAGSPKPKREIIRASLVTLRDITLSVGGSVAAQAIMHRFGAFGM